MSATIATTPWDRTSQDFKKWLEAAWVTKEEYNALEVPARVNLKSQFDDTLKKDAEGAKRQKGVAYKVHAVVRGGLNSSGARGNVFKMLEKYCAVYVPADGIQIEYNEDDLYIQALFLEWEQACGFQSALNKWEIHKELANLNGVTIDPRTPVEVERPRTVCRIILQDYRPGDSESPCESLHDLPSYRLSVPVTEAVEPGSLLATFQSVDRQQPFLLPYKCHLKDKAKFKSLQANENNMLAASWPFHQMMDGLHTEDGLPMVCISVQSQGDAPSASHGDRVPVTLRLEFRHQSAAAGYVGNTTTSKRINETVWDVTVYVTDPKLFCDCVAWKENDTRQKWLDHQQFLDSL
jgi:hypothetical protein